MVTTVQLRKRLFYLPVVLIIWIAVLGWLGRLFNYIDLWGLMLVGAALITFFGFLRIPIADEDQALSESGIRLAICATILIVYILYFGSAVYLNPTVDANGKELRTFSTELFPTLTNLLSVTVAFYFGSSAAVSIAKKK